MCGLLFVYRPEWSPDRLTARMASALVALAHRGPDDSGSWSAPGVALGSCRLAIIDLEGSRQPMPDRNGRFVLAYNGEIYNYRELRAELEGRWAFRTRGDTEVALAGLALDGAAFLRRLEGMWALALWDGERRRLLLSRDRMGKKPLYYRLDGDGLAAASELPALRHLADGPWSEDLDGTADYFRYGFYLPGRTAYSEVREVDAGSYLTWRPGEAPRQDRYWSLEPPRSPPALSVDEARSALRELLPRAVRRRLVADVEVGAFLSGGIDSSLLVAILCREIGVTPKTFSIGFTEPSYDESRHAREVARRFGTDHHEEILGGWETEQLAELLERHVGQPFLDASLLPTALVSRLAARSVKVALSGDGADEIFSGYQRYQARVLLRWYSRLPAALRGTAEAVVRALPEPLAHHSGSLLKKAHLFVAAARRDEEGPAYVAPTWLSAAELAELAPDLAGRGHPSGLPEETGPDDLLRMMLADALVYLPQDILTKVDRASMRHSLECRAPYLDREVVELAFSLPSAWHRRGHAGKRMLRETFPDLLPRSVWRRRKQGFGVPLGHWFRAGLGDDLRALLAGETGPIAAPVALRLLEEHRRRRHDHGFRLWGLYVYLLWRARGGARETSTSAAGSPAGPGGSGRAVGPR